MILGLDASTKCIGWTLLHDDGSYSDAGYLLLDKVKSLYEKSKLFQELLVKIYSRPTPGGLSVFVEAPLPRSNNQNVVNLLQRWSGMVCLVIYNILRKEPQLIEQKTALKKLGIIVPKGVKGKDRKEYILQVVKDQQVISENVWQDKKTGKPKDFCFDVADSYIIAKAAHENYQEKEETGG